MDFLFSVFFGAGVAGWTYSKFGRRIGYGNTQNQLVTTGVVFVLATLFFFTVLKYILNI